jgi:hypothetical protein
MRLFRKIAAQNRPRGPARWPSGDKGRGRVPSPPRVSTASSGAIGAGAVEAQPRPVAEPKPLLRAPLPRKALSLSPDCEKRGVLRARNRKPFPPGAKAARRRDEREPPSSSAREMKSPKVTRDGDDRGESAKDSPESRPPPSETSEAAASSSLPSSSSASHKTQNRPPEKPPGDTGRAQEGDLAALLGAGHSQPGGEISPAPEMPDASPPESPPESPEQGRTDETLSIQYRSLLLHY